MIRTDIARTLARYTDSDLYFGFGSNLDEEDWRTYCARRGFDVADLEPLMPARLPDHVLVFDHLSTTRNGGTLGVRECIGGHVDGYLFAVKGRGWEALDLKEGNSRRNPAGSHHVRVKTTVIPAPGLEVAVQTYMTAPARRQQYVQPSQEYLEICRRGRRRLGLDTVALDAAAGNQPPPITERVFVYGTLMRGESRFGVIASAVPEAILLGDAQGRLVDHGAYPGMSEGNGVVTGEIVRCSSIEALLPKLDRIEGFDGFGAHGNLFRRTLIDAGLDGRPRLCWVYFSCSEGEVIVSGSWRQHRGTEQRFLEALLEAHAAESPLFPERLADELTPPGSINPYKATEMTLTTLQSMLASGELSELHLSRASGNWVVCPGDKGSLRMI